MDENQALGSGGYAVVRRAVRRVDSREVAIKIIQVGKGTGSGGSEDEDQDDEDDDGDDDKPSPDKDGDVHPPGKLSFEEIMTEIEVVERLNHDHIVNIHEFFIHRSNCYIVMQLLRGAELMDALIAHGPYTEDDVKVMMGALLDAVAYMHLHGVTHRDLKLENLVLARPQDLSSVTIVDFGLAKAARAREKMEDICGTLWYYAPEIVNAKPYTPLVDEWALGVSMYLLFTGKFPFDAEDDDDEDAEEQLCLLISDGDFDMSGEVWKQVSPQAIDMLKGLLTARPEERLPAADALEHSWFTGSAKAYASTAKQLRHTHSRLQQLVTSTQRPITLFKQGQWLVEHNDHAGNSGSGGEEQSGKDEEVVYLLQRGECELLVEREGWRAEAAQATSLGRAIDETQRWVRVGMRRQGNFIGQGEIELSAQQLRALEPVYSADLSYPPSSAVGAGERSDSGVGTLVLRSSSGPPSPVAEEGGRLAQWDTSSTEYCAASTVGGDVDQDQEQQVLRRRPEPLTVGGPPAATVVLEEEEGGEEEAEATGGDDLSSPSSPGAAALAAGSAIGHQGRRRKVWARAVSAEGVEAVQLAREDMQWAVEADYRLGVELRKAMHERRSQVRRKLRIQARADAANKSSSAAQKAATFSPELPTASPRWSPLYSPSFVPRPSPTLRGMSGRATTETTAISELDAMPLLSLDGDCEGLEPNYRGTPSPLSASSADSNSARGGRGGGGGDPTWDDPAHTEQAEHLAAYKAGVVEMLQEYFQALEVGEVAARLDELQSLCGEKKSGRGQGAQGAAGTLGAVFVKRALVTALDFTAREFELTSVLLAALTPGMISAADISAGFSALIFSLDDLALDVPTAPALLSLFLARAVLDDCLPVASLNELKRTLDLEAERRMERIREDEAQRRARSQMTVSAAMMSMGGAGSDGGVKTVSAGETAVRAALALVESPHGPARVLRAWGGGGAGTIAHSKRAFSLVLKEYLVGGDAAEAEARIRELKVPHFHHEFVKKALTFAIEQSFAEEGAVVVSPGVVRLVALLVHCSSSGLILSDQLCLGWERLGKVMPDLSLDVPGARGAKGALKVALREAGLEVEPEKALATAARAERVLALREAVEAATSANASGDAESEQQGPEPLEPGLAALQEALQEAVQEVAADEEEEEDDEDGLEEGEC